MNESRVRLLKQGKDKDGPVIYWMSRDQRLYDNWSVVYAQRLALKKKQPLVIVFCLVKKYMGATLRQYDFMLRGLEEVATYCNRKNIPFYVMVDDPLYALQKCIRKYKASVLVTDFDPLRVKRRWKAALLKSIDIPFYEVDAHNIVPCWIASQKQEYGANTFRPKLHGLLSDYLDEFPKVKKQVVSWSFPVPEIKWDALRRKLKVDKKVKPVEWIKPGFRSGMKMLDYFCQKKLRCYDEKRNNPVDDGQSHLSPFLHYGQISAQRIALTIYNFRVSAAVKDPFLDELIVRRELADNYCWYSPRYDSFKAFPVWAQNSLVKHWEDKREYVYSRSQFDKAKTHDDLWNAAQSEMVRSGKMHGYMRMYWAKKILEWSRDPEEAIDICIYLNDKYQLDGRDPNGYAGIAWSLGGVHDRAWGERPIFGKIRFMSHNGCRAKFDVARYVEKVANM